MYNHLRAYLCLNSKKREKERVELLNIWCSRILLILHIIKVYKSIRICWDIKYKNNIKSIYILLHLASILFQRAIKGEPILIIKEIICFKMA